MTSGTHSKNEHDNAVGEQPALSEYEQARARNIERNNARLRALGLISAAEECRSNDVAWGRHLLSDGNGGGEDDDGGEESTSSDEEYSEGQTPSKRKKKRTRSTLPPREGSRKSRRLMNLPSETASGDIADDDRETAVERRERIRKEREALVVECREARQRAAIEVAKAGAEVAGAKNPTATYEHCLMRVRSMTEKGLMNRVRAIERASGKHCVVKMAIFKSCLQDEGMWELAKLASEALERLKGLLPPPSD